MARGHGRCSLAGQPARRHREPITDPDWGQAMVSPRSRHHLAAVLDRLLVQLACCLALLVALGGPAACSAAEPGVPVASPAFQGRFVAAVLVAGSSEQAVFENARRDLAAVLRQVIGCARRDLAQREPPANPVATSPGDAGEHRGRRCRDRPKALACFVFGTSHGTQRGLVLSYRRRCYASRLDVS